MFEEKLDPGTDPNEVKEENEVNDQSAVLIVGLGNPGKRYRDNRHNIGFLVLDHLATHFDLSFNRMRSKALIIESSYEDHKVVLAKPQSYMNLSGSSVKSLMKYYQITLDNLLVVYDDVDLPLGKMRLRPFGGSAGQKGMQSIIEQLDTQGFPRMRLGIGRPPGRMETADYVLQDFAETDREILEMVLDRAVEAVLMFTSSGLEAAMNKFNQSDREDDSG